MSKVDLHVHTTASDGKYSPSEIVRKAYLAGLRYISITDHDSIDGVAPAREAANSIEGICVISGVEINTDVPSGELHILGYMLDIFDPELAAALYLLRNSRVTRAKKMISKLNSLDVIINYERVKELAGSGSIGRPHIARALHEKGYINSFKEAFTRYIGRGGPAYIERAKITPEEAVKLVIQAGGLPVLAHPLTLDNCEIIIAKLKDCGLIGLETYYGNYSPAQVAELIRLAKKYGLITTGGSDFHGVDPVNELPLGTVPVPLECAEQLLKIKGSQ